MAKKEGIKSKSKKTTKKTNLKNTTPKKINSKNKVKKIKTEKTTKKQLNDLNKYKFDALKLEISIIQRFTQNIQIPVIADLEELD